MADDRLFSRSLGHGERITQLTDLEYRVWTQYILSADDFGVMRCSALTIRNDHAALALRPEKAIGKALERLIDVSLVVAFEHQNRRYLCQLNWQDFQKRTWTTRTIQPMPPVEILARCTPMTRHLFTVHKGGVKVPKFVLNPEDSQRPAEVSPELVQSLSGLNPDKIQTLSVHARNTNTTTNTNTSTDTNTSERQDFRWEQFKAAYPPKGREQGFMALQFFLKGCDTVGFDVVMAGVERYAKSKTVRDGYVMGMEKWLSKGLWIQEPEVPEDTKAESNKKALEYLKQIDADRASRGR